MTITHGCENFCSYCIVPVVRGKLISFPSHRILDYIRLLAGNGTREITLLGQNVNQYGTDNNDIPFHRLLESAALVPGIERINFITSHPKDFIEDILLVIRDHSNISRSIHLPLQSGSDRILGLMNRGYTIRDYLGIIEKIRALLADHALSTDLIVGFPGESEDEFEETLRAMEQIRFDDAFTYAYSPREGTPAFSLPESLTHVEKIARLERLIALQRGISHQKLRERIDREEETIIEGFSKKSPDRVMGRTYLNHNVVLPGSGEDIGKKIRIKIDGVSGATLRGHELRSVTLIMVSLLLTASAGALLASPTVQKGAKTEQEYLSAVRERAKLNDGDGVKKQSSEFFKLYPESPLIPDVRLVLAEFEESPEGSIAKYRVLVNKYGYYRKRDYALLRICEIEYLQARWKELGPDARAGLDLAAGGYKNDFRYFLIISQIRSGEYDTAEKECRGLIDTDHDYNNMARSLLILAHIHRNTSGLSREYITTIREIAVGYDRSDALPATLYLLGEFYEQKGMFDESYSAYSDLAAKYPGSPEATEAAKRIGTLRKHTPAPRPLPAREKDLLTTPIALTYALKRRSRMKTRDPHFTRYRLGRFHRRKARMGSGRC